MRGIKDTDFEITAEIKENKDDDNLMQFVIAIWKQQRKVTNKGSTDSKYRNKMRRVCGEDGCYLHEDIPFKRARLPVEKDETL